MSKLEFDLSVKNNQLDVALDSASKKSGSLQGALTTALGVFAGGLALKGFELLGDAMSESVAFAKESVKAFSEQEDALNKLSQSLKATGSFSNAAIEDFNGFASAMQKTTVFGDEVILNQLAIAKAFGATNAQSKELVTAAANLSATFGGSLDDNLEKLGKTLNGNIGKLGQFIPELKNLSKEQLAAGEAADFINSKFGGAAESQLKTYSGSVTAAANAFSDMQEEIGRLIAKNSITTSFISGLKSGFEGLGNAAKGVADALGIGLSPLQEQRTKIADLGKEYNTLTDNIKNARIQMETNKKFGGDTSGDAARLAAIIESEGRLNQILQERRTIRQAISGDKAAADVETPKAVPQDILDARKKLNDEILYLDQQLLVEQNNLALESDNAQIENDVVRQQAEIQRITDFAATKAELEFQLKEQEMVRTLDGEDQRLAVLKLAGEKELALTKIKNDGIIKQANSVREAEKKANDLRIAQQQATSATMIGIIGTAANISTIFTKDGSKEQFYIQKAAALSQAGIATYLAMAMANAVPPPGNIPAIAAAKANGAVAISGILASTIKGFQDGGIIGGEGQGATSGPDNTTFKGRKGEMVLTGEDQSMLLNGIRNGTLGGGGDIVIQIGEDVIFRAVRNQIKKGYRLQ